MPLLVLPPSLAQLCSLPRELEVPGATVAQMLANAAKAYPELGRNLLDETGAPRRHYAAFFRNDEDLRQFGGLQTDVKPEDVVTLLPPIAGGLLRGEPAEQGGRQQEATWLREARAHAEEAYPEEACGLVVSEGGELRAVRGRNLSSNPCEHFELDPRALLPALESRRLRGFYHSHPDGLARPSAEDLERAALWGPDLEWTIIAVAQGRAGEAAAFRAPMAAEGSTG